MANIVNTIYALGMIQDYCIRYKETENPRYLDHALDVLDTAFPGYHNKGGDMKSIIIKGITINLDHVNCIEVIGEENPGIRITLTGTVIILRYDCFSDRNSDLSALNQLLEATYIRSHPYH